MTQRPACSVVSLKFLDIFRAGHPVWRRYSSLKYSRYSRSSRLASRAPRSGKFVEEFERHDTRGRRFWCVTLLIVAAASLLPAPPALAQRDERHRVPAEAMSFKAAQWLERDERIEEEQPEEVLDSLGIGPGDIVADVGCGSGYYARRIARRVMPGGKVYCNDIQPEMLDVMKQLASSEGVTGIEPILGDLDDPKLPAGELDWILIADVYHEMSDPEPMLAGMRRGLAPDGRIALLEYRAEDGTGDHVKADHTMSVRQVLAEWKPAGYELLDLRQFLPGQHLFIFRASGSQAPGEAVQDFDLVDAIAQKKVEVEARGAGQDGVTVRLRRTGGDRLVITAPVGLYFRAKGGARDMIARRDSVVALFDDGWIEWTIRAVGRQRDRPEATAADAFDVLPPATAPKLAELMYAIQVGTYTVADSPTLYIPRTHKLEQTAVWIAEHDLPYEELAPFAEDPRIPAPYVVAFSLVFLDRAGIDVTDRRVWNDRDEVFGILRDRGLEVWYGLKNGAPVR